MKYENGKDIFPEPLLKQIQKYAAGKLIYIPSAERRDWGEMTGYRTHLLKRNRDIRRKFQSGETVERLAGEYSLSCETIRKIIYSKKEMVVMEYKGTLSSAVEYAKNGKLEEWVHTFLLSDGHNRDFSDGLKLLSRCFLGPMKMPLSFFKRCCGPEEYMKWRVNRGFFEQKVGELQRVIAENADLPPLIVHYAEGEFELNDGNHRLEAYSRMGIKEYYVIVWITEKAEYEDFMGRYSKYI